MKVDSVDCGSGKMADTEVLSALSVVRKDAKNVVKNTEKGIAGADVV